ncbi:ABC transporter permease [Paenibacillus sp. CAU 1782]
MFNLLRMELRRFAGNKVVPLLLLLFGAFQLFGIFMMGQYQSSMEVGGLSVSTMNEIQFIQNTLAQPPAWMLLYLAVFTVYFYMSEYNSGFYKNYIGMRHARVHSVLSKMVVQALFTLLLFAVMLIVDLVGRQLFFGQAAIGDLGYLLKLLIGQFLLHFAFTVLVLCITMVARNPLLSVAVGIVIALNVHGMVLAVLEEAIGSPRLSRYLLVNTITGTKDLGDSGDLIHVFGVAAVALFIFGLIAVRYKMKEDLR